MATVSTRASDARSLRRNHSRSSPPLTKVCGLHWVVWLETGSDAVGKVALSEAVGNVRQSCGGAIFGILHDPPEHTFEKANFLRRETG